MGNPVQVRALSNAPSEYNGLQLPERKRRDRFLRSAKGIMNPSFKPYRTGMLTVKEKYSCGCGDGHKGRNHVYYLCQCDCGREVIFSGDEISHHPYSCGCTPKPLATFTIDKTVDYSVSTASGKKLGGDATTSEDVIITANEEADVTVLKDGEKVDYGQ